MRTKPTIGVLRLRLYNARIKAKRLALENDDLRLQLEQAGQALKELVAAAASPYERLCCDGRDCGCHGATVLDKAVYEAGEFLEQLEAIDA